MFDCVMNRRIAVRFRFTVFGVTLQSALQEEDFMWHHAHKCNEYPLTSHFYIVKLGFTGAYLIYLFLLFNID